MFFLPSIFNIFFYVFTISLSVWTWNTHPAFRAWVETQLLNKAGIHVSSNKEITVFAPQFSAEHFRNELSSNKDSKLIKHIHLQHLYYPSLVLQLKFVNDSGESEEGFLLWDMQTGEIVLDPTSWTTSKGISELLFDSFATPHIALLTYIYNHNEESQGKRVNVDSLPANMEEALSDCIRRGIITYIDGNVNIHIKDPLIPLSPPILDDQTRKQIKLVPYKDYVATRSILTQKYSAKQIIHTLTTLFGKHCVIKQHEIIYLPVYMLRTTLKSGEISYAYFHAYSGKQADIFI